MIAIAEETALHADICRVVVLVKDTINNRDILPLGSGRDNNELFILNLLYWFEMFQG